MKRHELIRELVDEGCYLKRRGTNHDIYINLANGRKAPVPRHTEIRNSLCMLIRKQLGIKEKTGK
ncbi:MAG: type II toxin-antitoxin system HicA family toxin [bacterium]